METKQLNPWDPPSNSESSDDLLIMEDAPPSIKEGKSLKTAKDGTVSQKKKKKEPITQGSNSEEDDVVILEPDSISCRSGVGY